MKPFRTAIVFALIFIVTSAVHAERFWEYTIPAGTQQREFEPDIAHGGGPWVVHWLNGAMVGEISYLDRVGAQKWEERPVRNGGTHGTVRGWWPDGALFKAITFRDDLRHGLEAFWTPEGALSSLYFNLNGVEVSYAAYCAAWQEDQANLPPPTMFGLPGSWVGGQDPDANLSDADRNNAGQAERLLNESVEEFRKQKTPVTSGPNQVPPNPEVEALRKLQAALSGIMKISDPRKRAELLLRAARQAVLYREQLVHYAHIQQCADIAASALGRVPDAIGKMDAPPMRAQFYRDLAQGWRSLAKIAVFQHPTLTPTYCDQNRAKYEALAEQESRKPATSGGTAGGGGSAGGAVMRLALAQMGLSLDLPQGFTPIDASSIPVMLRGPGQRVGMMIHMEEGAVDLQEFSTIFMRDIGPAMGAGDLQELGRDTIDVGEGMPGLLALARATVNNTTADFEFLFFIANERTYTFAYFAPTATFGQHEAAFFRLLTSVTLGG